MRLQCPRRRLNFLLLSLSFWMHGMEADLIIANSADFYCLVRLHYYSFAEGRSMLLYRASLTFNGYAVMWLSDSTLLYGYVWYIILKRQLQKLFRSCHSSWAFLHGSLWCCSEQKAALSSVLMLGNLAFQVIDDVLGIYSGFPRSLVKNVCVLFIAWKRIKPHHMPTYYNTEYIVHVWCRYTQRNNLLRELMWLFFFFTWFIVYFFPLRKFVRGGEEGPHLHSHMHPQRRCRLLKIEQAIRRTDSALVAHLAINNWPRAMAKLNSSLRLLRTCNLFPVAYFYTMKITSRFSLISFNFLSKDSIKCPDLPLAQNYQLTKIKWLTQHDDIMRVRRAVKGNRSSSPRVRKHSFI